MKVCKTCGDEKPLDDFYRHATTRDGRDGSCKSCLVEKRRARRQRFSELVKSTEPPCDACERAQRCKDERLVCEVFWDWCDAPIGVKKVRKPRNEPKHQLWQRMFPRVA